jgi:hypothetical protein
MAILEALKVTEARNQVQDAGLRFTDVLQVAGRGCGNLAWARAWRQLGYGTGRKCSFPSQRRSF